MRINLAGLSMVEQSIAVLQEYEPPEGYWLAFSGGKDSVVIHRLAEMARVKFDAHYSLTTIDPPELVQFIRREYPQVGWRRPDHTFYWHVERRGFPTRLRRWCCEEFKESGGRGRVILTGIRAEESANRARRGQVEVCLRHPDKVFVNPIRDWTAAEVWEFIRAQGLPHCSLYDEGWKRIGCTCCPFEHQVERSQARWPRIWANVLRAFCRGWARCGEDGFHGFREARRRWASPEACFEWWCSRDRPYPELEGNDDGQPALFV
jgi:phosphoadenosine phosphosulfate reductase